MADMTDAMTRETAAALLEPFPAEQIGLLPRVTCSACSKAQAKHCGEHQRRWCDECKSMISERHIHLSYVGHADVTRRLSEVDPSWSWEPFGTDSNGLPLADVDDSGNPVGLWIRLTVCGVTRPGYGSCPSSQNDAVKVLIGDALRNAALRFGVAVDLWAKGDRAAPSMENATASAGKATKQTVDPVTQLKREVVQAGLMVNLRLDDDTLNAKFAELNGGLVLSDATEPELRSFRTWLEKEYARGQRQLSKDTGTRRDGLPTAENANGKKAERGPAEEDPWVTEPVGSDAS